MSMPWTRIRAMALANGVAAARLAAQLLLPPGVSSPEEVAQRLLAVQAQDQRAFRLAVRSRSHHTDIRDVDSLYLPRGIVMNKDLSKVVPYDQTSVTESVYSAWYDYDEGPNAALHPWRARPSPTTRDRSRPGSTCRTRRSTPG